MFSKYLLVYQPPPVDPFRLYFNVDLFEFLKVFQHIRNTFLATILIFLNGTLIQKFEFYFVLKFCLAREG